MLVISVNINMSGKVAVVTGAARGLGKAFMEALLKRGHRVSYLYMLVLTVY